MSVTYCNITTDLSNAYAKIEEYASTRFRIRGYSIESQSGFIYKSFNPGNIEVFFEDSIQLTSVSAVASINAASKYYYDATNDIIYVRVSDATDPDTHIMEKGFDWTALKTRVRNRAQDEIDGYLDAKFPRPIPMSRQYHVSDINYDFGLVKATSLLTCANILNMFGDFENAVELRNQVIDPVDNGGIIDRYNDGRMRFSWETTPDELGRFNIEQNSANTGAGFIELNGRYGGDDDIDEHVNLNFALEDQTWYFEMDTAGAVGTATFKWSRDGGTTFESELKVTSEEWLYLATGIFIRFWDRGSTFADSDNWKAYMHVERRPDIIDPPTKILRG